VVALACYGAGPRLVPQRADGPIALFFLITAPDYGFFKLLNVAILALSALVGLRFLTGGMRVLNENGLLAPEKPVVPATPAEAPVSPALAPTGATATTPANGSGGTTTLTAPAPAPVQAAPVVPPGYMLTPISHHPRPVRLPKESQPTPPSMTLLYVWILLFGFVGTQLAWTLRPFFGSPGMKFSLYRDIDGNFYAEILRTLSHLF
jgi:hypothetical protein